MIQKRGAASSAKSPQVRSPRWLLLVYHLPTRPSNARVKTWRRLQKLGALAVRGSAYALPDSPEAREDFEWMKTEVTALGGQATVFAAEAADSISHDELVAEFRAVRSRDYAAVRAEAEAVKHGAMGRATRGTLSRRRERVTSQLRERLAAVELLDFFQAGGREEAEAAVAALEGLREGGEGAMARSTGKGRLRVSEFQNRHWVTRPRPGIDRMACAWLIRRFIDPRARFGFAPSAEKSPKSVPFDMYGVEFSHQGNACSFETLVRRFGLPGQAIRRIAQIVHDLDLKDAKHDAPEAAAVGLLVEGLRQMYSSDSELLERGMAMIEALYRSFTGEAAGRAGGAKHGARHKRSARPIASP